VGGLKLNDHPWGGYGYFLETHNIFFHACNYIFSRAGYIYIPNGYLIILLEQRYFCFDLNYRKKVVSRLNRSNSARKL